MHLYTDGVAAPSGAFDGAFPHLLASMRDNGSQGTCLAASSAMH